MARMIVIYQKPKDVATFERHYFEKHVPLAKQLPGIRTYEVSRGPVLSPAGPSDAWIVATLHFDSINAIQAAFASDIGKACAVDRQAFAPDPATFHVDLR